jgi:hypothetical protein
MMARGYGTNGLGVLDSTQSNKLQSGLWAGGSLTWFTEELDLSLASVLKAIADDNVICDLPPGYKVAWAEIESTVGLGTSEFQLGEVGGTVDKFGLQKAYGAAANAIVRLNNPANRGGLNPSNKLTRIILTNRVAVLPGAGKIYVTIVAARQG